MGGGSAGRSRSSLVLRFCASTLRLGDLLGLRLCYSITWLGSLISTRSAERSKRGGKMMVGWLLDVGCFLIASSRYLRQLANAQARSVVRFFETVRLCSSMGARPDFCARTNFENLSLLIAAPPIYPEKKPAKIQSARRARLDDERTVWWSSSLFLLAAVAINQRLCCLATTLLLLVLALHKQTESFTIYRI